MEATALALAARDHSNDARQQMAGANDRLKETLSYIIGTREDAINGAAGDLNAVAEIVGSTTASELSAGYAGVSEQLGGEVIGHITAAIDILNRVDGQLASLGDSTEQLAQVLGG